jgi:SAM-dependent methyltransferase
MENKIFTNSDLSLFTKISRDKNYPNAYPHYLWEKPDAIIKWVSINERILGKGNNLKIVDLGCGKSCNPKILSNAGNKVIGLDLDPESYNYYNNEVEIKIGDAMELLKELEESSIDVFYDSCAVTHFNTNFDGDLPNIGWLEVAKSVKRALKPGGIFVIASDCRISDSEGEFISPNQIIEIVESTGLKLSSEYLNSSEDLYEYEGNGPMYVVGLTFKK